MEVESTKFIKGFLYAPLKQDKKLASLLLWRGACFLFGFLFLLCACNRGKGDTEVSNLDSVLYTTCTTDVYTLISDSGITKYKLQAKYWYTYDEPVKKWVFPMGLHLEQFDLDFNKEASIDADTAYYYQDKQLWELKNNVSILNRNGQRFFAETLFWDEEKEEVYSHDPVQIERTKGEFLLAKYGFKSNQTMTKYELYSSSGHLDVHEQDDTATKKSSALQPATNETLDSIPHSSLDSLSKERPHKDTLL